jgi:nucleoside-diphosphate-sugar epimerase
MKHLIVGASSGLGRAVAKSLLEKGQEVTALVRSKTKAEKYFKDLSCIKIIEGDASDTDNVLSALKDCSTLFYCVNIPYPQWKEKARPLLSASIKAAITAKVKFVFPGNVYIYGYALADYVNERHPRNAHTSKGKIRIEMENMLDVACREKGLCYTIVRMPDFYGPYVINTFSETFFINALQGKTLRWFGNLDFPYETIFIEDAGKALVTAALSEKSNGKDFNVPGFGEITPQKFLAEISRQGGKNSKVTSINSPFAFTLLGLVNPVAYEFKEMLYLKQKRFLLDGLLFNTTFGRFQSTSYKEGIEKTLVWAKDYFNIP